MAQDWAANVKKYAPAADDDIIAGIVRYCGIALRNRDSSLVSFTDPEETGRVRKNFLKKKLALTDSDEVLDAAIATVGALMKGENFKNRVTVYYLLADHFSALEIFRKKASGKTATAAKADDGGNAGAAGAAAAAAGALGLAALGGDNDAPPAPAKAAPAKAAAPAASAPKATAPTTPAATPPPAAPAPVAEPTPVPPPVVPATPAAVPVSAPVPATEPASEPASASVAPAALASVAAGGVALAGGVAANSTTDSAPPPPPTAALHDFSGGPATGRTEEEQSGLGWLWWLALLLLGLFLIWLLFFRGAATDSAPATPTEAVSTDTTGAAPAGDVSAATGATDFAQAAAEGSAAIPAGAGVTSELRDGKPVVKVYFDTGKTDVVPAFAPAASGLSAWLTGHTGTSLAVSGYNDATGNAAANAELSKNRAIAVRDALIASGIPEASVELVKPEQTTDTTVAADAARRVEVVVR